MIFGNEGRKSMTFIFISPDFPKTYYHFCEELLKNGVNVLGIASTPYEYLPNELKNSLTEYYRISNMENYNAIMIVQGKPQSERIVALHKMAVKQLETLSKLSIENLPKNLIE